MEKADFYREADRDQIGPMAGTRVLEVTTTWAGPMCGCMLGDLGADVIKVELAEGEVARRLPPYLDGTDPPISFAHATVNRNKRSLRLDLRTDGGRRVALRLAERSDVLVENFRAGALAGWGLGYEHVRAVKPDIVYVSITGFGQFGPNHDRVGYDPLAQAASGFISLNGERDGPPVKAPTFLADDLAGLHGAVCALAALHHRDRTGEGQHIDVALLDAMLFQSDGFLTLGALGTRYPRMGNEYIFAAPARIFPCKDGHVYLGVLLDSHWKALAEVMGRPDLAEDPEYAITTNRVGHRDEVNEIVAVWCAERPVAQVIDEIGRAGLPIAPVQTYEQAASDPHVQARDMLQPTMQPDGTTIPITGPAGKFSRTPTRVRSAAPDTGQHDQEILAELGLDGEEIAALGAAGAFGT
ncbi:MAG: CoA transferase [Proteobacteria bacterium]|nr:CoA transferase [Pseudomonadota bacterium]